MKRRSSSRSSWQGKAVESGISGQVEKRKLPLLSDLRELRETIQVAWNFGLARLMTSHDFLMISKDRFLDLHAFSQGEAF